MILSQAHTLAIEDVLYLEIGVHYLKRCALFGFFCIFGVSVGPEQKILLVWPKHTASGIVQGLIKTFCRDTSWLHHSGVSLCGDLHSGPIF